LNRGRITRTSYSTPKNLYKKEKTAGSAIIDWTDFLRAYIILLIRERKSPIISKTKQQNPRRIFTSEFKQKIVDLHHSGKRKCDIIREYDISSSMLNRWITQAGNTGSFKESDNRSPAQVELLKLRKENKRLLMENDILKQAALIMGQK